MKLAIFSDIHGNIMYLRSCLSKMTEYRIDKFIFLGDAVGYMPSIIEVLELLRSINADCLMGNHEAMLLGKLTLDRKKDVVYNIEKSKGQLDFKNLQYISSWLPFKEWHIDKCKLLFVHGAPWNPLNGYVYEKDLQPDDNYSQFNFVFMGHIHRPYIKCNKNTTFVNVGSCGLPRDYGNMPSFAILDTKTCECNIIRLKLNVAHYKFEKMDLHESVISCLYR